MTILIGSVPGTEAMSYGNPSLSAMPLDRVLLAGRVEEYLARTHWSRELLLTHQQEALEQILAYAVRASPFYRGSIGKLVARHAPLTEYPVLTKSTLMANFDSVVTDARLSRAALEQHLSSNAAGDLFLNEYVVAATGGTTGERGVFAFDREEWLSVIANIARFQRLLGVTSETRNLGIGAPSPIHLSYRFYEEMRAVRPDAPAISVITPMEKVVEALNRYQPEIFSSYPSFIRLLVEEQRAGRLSISPRIVRSVAETLTEDVATLIRETWGAAVNNGYAATEFGVFGMGCREVPGIHVAEDLVVFEVVDKDNHPVPAGTAGAKVLVTSLENRTIPLIRYELSDIVTMAHEPCACGSSFARIDKIEGRQEEVLQLPGKHGGIIEVHAIRLRSPLIAAPGVKQFQLFLNGDELEVAITIAAGFEPEVTRRETTGLLLNALRKLNVGDVHLNVRVVDAIPRTGGGAKQKLVATQKKTPKS
ncbi:MAG TPA: AMP-binding protein [Pyrinomonadaceae bacterium]|nr:AMP-binding protein [Pyrinomonadaceae bacterium]